MDKLSALCHHDIALRLRDPPDTGMWTRCLCLGVWATWKAVRRITVASGTEFICKEI